MRLLQKCAYRLGAVEIMTKDKSNQRGSSKKKKQYAETAHSTYYILRLHVIGDPSGSMIPVTAGHR